MLQQHGEKYCNSVVLVGVEHMTFYIKFCHIHLGTQHLSISYVHAASFVTNSNKLK